MKRWIVFAALALLLLPLPARGAVDTLRGDLIGTWYDDQNPSERILIFDGDGTATWGVSNQVNWTYEKGLVTIYDPERNQTDKFEIIAEAHGRMTVQWTTDNDRIQVLRLDTSSDTRANFAFSDLVNTYEYTSTDGDEEVKTTYIFSADGYGTEASDAGDSDDPVPFTWTYSNPDLTIVGQETRTYTAILFAEDYLTLLHAGELQLWKQK
jgi:hypothetical protein